MESSEWSFDTFSLRTKDNRFKLCASLHFCALVAIICAPLCFSALVAKQFYHDH